ncbi:CD48 antigen-like isoform X1 [Moschus berezovskii]|uniref:CD48 antigen-like isoform X1 n=1 Tax=Moschus berezovskii TaxID=68408 RepID=UPI0024438033|nr:CD48 antigen-like isoform X1 [Moschus berezovskii]XP_055259142.1 CD48 antigen-like isoform X1 [Moschus berezovskii]
MDSLCSSWLPTQTLILPISLIFGLASPSPDSQAVKYPSSSCTLKRTVGASVQLTLTSSLYPNIREIEWNWQPEDHEKTQLLVSWKPQTPNPEWYDLEEIYKHRLNLTEMGFLSIRNLTMKMSGLYTAKIKFHSGKLNEEEFRLCLYDPIPHPHIQIRSSSKTSGWCNISLECEIPGNTGNLTVTWLSQGLLRHLEQRGIPPNSRNLSLSLPISLVNSHLTCVASNPAEEKNATLHLEDICPWRGSLQSKWLWLGILLMVLMVSLGAGVWIWMRKKMQTRRGESTLLPAAAGFKATPQALPTEESTNLQTGVTNSLDSPYEEIAFLRHLKKDLEKGNSHSHNPECSSAVHTIYEKIRTNPEPQGDA